MTTVNNSNVLMVDPMSISAADISEMDLETALLAVQMNRATQLEDQLKTQMTAVQAKNDQMAKLTTALSKLNGTLALCGTDITTNKPIGPVLTDADEMAINDALNAAGVYPFTQTDGVDSNGERLDADGNAAPGYVSGTSTRGELEAAIKQLDGMVTNLSNTQQMDMLKLQSLSNKRNEAYEIMTNFIKKLQENKSSIIANMR